MLIGELGLKASMSSYWHEIGRHQVKIRPELALEMHLGRSTKLIDITHICILRAWRSLT